MDAIVGTAIHDNVATNRNLFFFHLNKGKGGVVATRNLSSRSTLASQRGEK
jgi:hypothetical protein